jgi:hypothetical protein
MDLRNRDSYEQIVKDLYSVPSEPLHQLGRRLSDLSQTESKQDKESSSVRTGLFEREARSRMAKVGKRSGVMRLHAFSMIDEAKNSFSFRLCGDEIDDSSCFSDFVSKVEIHITPSGESLSWVRGEEPTDGITISRSMENKSRDIQIETTLHVNYRNCLYTVPGELLGTQQPHHVTFVELFRGICGYIKQHNLSSNDDPSYFTPDALLHGLLYPNHPKALPVSFASLLDVIRARFKAPGPFKVVHKIGSPEQVFDLVVQLPDSTDDTLISKLEDADQRLAGRMAELDSEMAELTSGIKETAEDALFLDKFCKNPVAFLADIIQMPTGAPAPVHSQGMVDFMNMATSHEFYKQPWAIAAAAYVVNEQKKEASA